MQEKIAVADLKLGMYVEKLDRPWLGTPFLMQGLHLQTDSDIKEVQRICEYVYISAQDRPAAAGAPAGAGQRSAQTESAPDPAGRRLEKMVRFAEHLDQAAQIRAKTERLIDTLHGDVRAGRRIDPTPAKDLVGDMVANIAYNPDVMVWLTHLKNRDRYTALHSLNVATLALVFGTFLEMDESELRELGLGALLHDIGKLRISLEVLNKPGKLLDDEYAVMKRHPEIGTELLKSSAGLSSDVLDIVYCHHERALGQGYPRGLRGDDIPFYAQIVAIVDVYDALTSDRVYRDGMSPAKAMKLMHGGKGKEFDPALLEQFTRCIGLFPAGSLVELSTGEVGVVIQGNGNKAATPIMMLILDGSKRKYYPLRILDLKLFETSPTAPKIDRVLPPGSYGIQTLELAGEIASLAG